MNKKTLLLVLPLLLTGCSKQTKYTEKIIMEKVNAFFDFDNDGKPLYKPVDAFNTSMYLTYYFDSKNDNTLALEEISNIYINTLKETHADYDRHNKYLNEDKEFINNLYILNESFGTGENVKCSENLYTLLKLSYDVFELTNGYFNIFTGRVTDYWEDCFDKAYDYYELGDFDPYYNDDQRDKLIHIVQQVPKTLEQINAQLTFNDDERTVRFNRLIFQTDEFRPLISLGGIGKGYATDLVKNKLLDKGYTDGYLMSGGSSIALISDPTFIFEPKKGQSIGLINPLNMSVFKQEPAITITTRKVFNSSTSGNYTTGKYYKFNDDNGHQVIRYHIFNPQSGYPENYHYQVSAISSTLGNGFLDALTTALMCVNISDGMQIISGILDTFSNSDLHVIWIDKVNDQATIYMSDNELEYKLGENVVLGKIQ